MLHHGPHDAIIVQTGQQSEVWRSDVKTQVDVCWPGGFHQVTALLLEDDHGFVGMIARDDVDGQLVCSIRIGPEILEQRWLERLPALSVVDIRRQASRAAAGNELLPQSATTLEGANIHVEYRWSDHSRVPVLHQVIHPGRLNVTGAQAIRCRSEALWKNLDRDIQMNCCKQIAGSPSYLCIGSKQYLNLTGPLLLGNLFDLRLVPVSELLVDLLFLRAGKQFHTRVMLDA